MYLAGTCSTLPLLPSQTYQGTNPFFTYIETVACHGVVSGYSDGTFRWGNDAIRAQIAKIVCVTSQDPPALCTSGTPQVTVTPQQ